MPEKGTKSGEILVEARSVLTGKLFVGNVEGDSGGGSWRY